MPRLCRALGAPVILVFLVVLTTLVSPERLGTLRAAGETVQIWVTTTDQSKLLQRQTDVAFGPDGAASPLTIDVNEGTAYQTIDGFGAHLTDSSAWLIWNRMSVAQRTTLMNNLFNPATGAGLSYLRQPMSASDFALADYTYDDTCCDLADFSISYDRAYILPLLRQALAINPAIRIMGSPWSAPAWMKTSNNLNNGSLRPEYYAMYANLFVRFVQAYQAEGVPIDAVTPQNEPLYEPGGYPGMRMEPTQQADFVKNHLGPAFASAGITAKIIVYDHNWDQPNYPITILNDAAARNYVAGSAFHCYAGAVDAQNQVHNAYPAKDIWFTECSGGAWSTDFGANLKWDMQNLVIGATRAWARNVLKWNMALDENAGPQNGGCTNCRGVVTINQSSGTVTYNVEYYALGHASKVTVPGARRIESNTYAGSLENVAFRNPDGSKALVVLNAAAAAQTFKVRWGGQAFTYTLPAGAVGSFKWAGTVAPTATPTATVTPRPTPTPTPRSALVQIEAESANVLNGVQLEACSDTGGGQDVGWTDTNDFIGFTGLDFAAGANGVQMRLASGAPFAGSIEVRLGSQTGTLIGTVPTSSTGGWQTWVTSPAGIATTTGLQNVYLVFRGGAGIVNVNWIRFTSAAATPTPTAPPTATSAARARATATATATPRAAATPTATATPSVQTIANGTYRILARHSGKALDVAGHGTGDGSNVQQWAYTAGNNQRWTVTHLGSGQYSIVGVESGKALDVAGGGTGNGTNVHVWTYFGNNQQKWTITSVGSGYYRLSPVHATTLALDVSGASTADGANVQVWTYGGNTNQQWGFQAP
jgi:O-glycosyl hydrolase